MGHEDYPYLPDEDPTDPLHRVTLANGDVWVLRETPGYDGVPGLSKLAVEKYVSHRERLYDLFARGISSNPKIAADVYLAAFRVYHASTSTVTGAHGLIAYCDAYNVDGYEAAATARKLIEAGE